MDTNAASIILGIIGAIPPVYLSFFWVKRKLNKVSSFADEKGERITNPIIEESLPIKFLEDNTILEKIRFLENQHKDLRESIKTARSHHTGDYKDLEVQAKQATKNLYDMRFLEVRDILDNRYYLHEQIGNGQTSVVWKAYDQEKDRLVAIKFLKYKYINDKSTIDCFCNGAKTMNNLRSRNIPAILEEYDKQDAETKLRYYVMDFISGTCLTKYISEHPDSENKILIVEKLIQIAECLADAHSKNIIHRDIKPNNILVEDNGTLMLVDFDAVTDLIDCYDTPPGVGTFGYSAPEVLCKEPFHDVRADVFSLARVIIYIYNSSELPCPYEKSNADVIDFLDCTPVMKETLKKATYIQPEKRYKTMERFINALHDAIESEKRDPPLFSVLNQEQHKVKKILTHSFWGTLIAISISRSLLAVNGSFLHLSNHWAIALMHGFFGSLFWGILIPFAFLCYFVKFPHKKNIWFYMLAMFICAISAGLGGVICASLSTGVTNAITLQFFGWIPEQIGTVKGISHTSQTINETRMFWVYPIIGFCTGAGVGLFLNFKMNELLNKKIKGITPIPMKNTESDKQPFLSTIKFIYSTPIHFFLFFPIIFPSLLQYIINYFNPNEYLLFKPSAHLYDKVYSDPLNIPMKYQDVTVPKLWRGLVESEIDFFVYQEYWRIFGEGFIQYCGSVGLLIGFFWGVSKYATKESKI